MEITFPIALIIGLFSTLHCFGMCGSISSVLTVSLPEGIKNDPPRLFTFIAAYNLGRVISYMSAGGLMGYLGSEMASSPYLQTGHDIARILSSVIIILVGLYISGWVPVLRKMDQIGRPLWRQIEPIGRSFLPVTRLRSALLFGCIWGWLPCGLVYYVLLLTLSADSAWQGAGYMLAFGLGTLPSMMSVGYLTGRFSRLAQNKRIRLFAGLLLVAFGVAGLLMNDFSI
jgi:sulfite exporter TauE/SafE